MRNESHYRERLQMQLSSIGGFTCKSSICWRNAYYVL